MSNSVLKSPAGTREKLFLIIAVCVLFLVFFVSLSAGRFPVSLKNLWRILFAGGSVGNSGISPIEKSVILNIRLPRVLMALIGGIGLGICGSVFQGIFRNPLVSPGIIGVTSGSGFGAALAILLFGWGPVTQLFSFLFGGVALLLTWSIAKKTRSDSILVFVLAGVIVNMFSQAMISLVKFLADSEEKLPSIVYWLMGSLSSCSWEKTAVSGPLIIICSLFLVLMRRRINLLSLGEETVRSLGVNPHSSMSIVLVLTTLIVSAIVSIAGIVGWIGLIIPHITRMITGPDHRILIPASALTGGIFFMVIDTVGRSISPQDVPLSILTAIIGAPLFILLLIRTKGEWNL